MLEKDGRYRVYAASANTINGVKDIARADSLYAAFPSSISTRACSRSVGRSKLVTFTSFVARRPRHGYAVISGLSNPH